MTTCQSCRHAWAQFRITWTQLQHMCVRTHRHTNYLFFGLPWSLLLCTLIGPCGCHAVARPRPCCVVIGVSGIAAWQRCFDWQVWPPALPCLPTWSGGVWGGRDGVGTGLAGGEGLACHMGQGACDEICDGQTQGRFNKTRVMASACVWAFSRLRKIWSKYLITNVCYGFPLNYWYSVHRGVMSRFSLEDFLWLNDQNFQII